MFARICAGAALLALGACTYGSQVDMAPHGARPWFSPVQPGRYCPVDLSGPAPMVEAGEDCGFIEWDSAARMLLMREPPSEDGPGEADIAAMASLGGGLYLVQEEDPDNTPRYSILTVLVHRKAFAAIAAIGEAPYRQVAARHPRVALSPDDGRNSMPWIESGSRAAIGALLKDASSLSLKADLAEDGRLDIVVLEEAGATEPHPPTPAQTKAIADLERRARALALRAPDGIDIE